MLFGTKIFLLLTCSLVIATASTEPEPCLLGGRCPMDDERLQITVVELRKELAILAAGDGPNYRISKAHSGTRVGARITEVNVDLIDENNQVKKCIVQMFWEKQHLDYVKVTTFDCEGEEKVVRKRTVFTGKE